MISMSEAVEYYANFMNNHFFFLSPNVRRARDRSYNKERLTTGDLEINSIKKCTRDCIHLLS